MSEEIWSVFWLAVTIVVLGLVILTLSEVVLHEPPPVTLLPLSD